MGFICFETGKFNNWGRCLKNTVRTHSVKSIMCCNWVHRYTFASINQLLLHLHNVLWLRDWHLIEVHATSCRPLWQLRVILNSNLITLLLGLRHLSVSVGLVCRECGLGKTCFWTSICIIKVQALHLSSIIHLTLCATCSNFHLKI